MAIRVQNNIASLTANKNLTRNTMQLTSSLEKLSSGFRINRAADDASGLSISQKMRAQIASLSAASRNASEAGSVLQVAEGGMEQVHGMLTRLKELATQSASANSDGNRSEIDAEAQKLLSEIDRIATSTEYNGTSLLNGYGAKTYTAALDTGIQNVYDIDLDSAATGSYTFAYNSGTRVLSLTYQGTTETATLATNSTISFGSLGMSFKITSGAPSLATIGASLAGLNGGADSTDFNVSGSQSQFQIGDTDATDKQLTFDINSVRETALGISTLSLSSQSAAQNALGTIDTAIASVNTARGEIGANMNRISYASANLQSSIENLTAGESVIRDVDMAAEMSKFTKNQILQQAGVAMLAQANALPQSVLSLLG